MLRGSWTHACARVTVGLAFALGASWALDAADAQVPAGQPPVAPSSAATPPGAPPSAAPLSSAADAPTDAPSNLPPPAAVPPSTVPSSPAATELDGPAPRTTAGTGGSTQSGSTQSGLAGCAVWTDRCVICQRDSGVIACSNIGIACQPQPMVCLRPEAAPETKPEH
jgi:hypothetical protein